MRPAIDQRARMIERFHNRKMAAAPASLEHHLCACIVLALLYGGSVRTCNGIARRIRMSYEKAEHRRRNTIEVCGND